MPSCVFRKCKNTTRNSNKESGVTFHSFPKDEATKNKWIKIIQTEQRDDEWWPNKYSKVCSAHFKEFDFFLTATGRRKIKTIAIPALRPYDENTSNEASCVPDEVPIFVTPWKEINKQKKNKTLSNKNTTLKSLINILSKKRLLLQEHLEELNMKAEEAEIFFKKIVRNKCGTGSFPRPLQKFVLALYYYTSIGYNYVRRRCNNILPHPHILARWHENIKADPGFTKQVFEVLKVKASNRRILATLIVGEMAIRQQSKWDGRKTLGQVDVGLGEQNLPATQAYVFMLVSNTETWKVPLGYFFINGIRAEQRATLIKMCIGKCFDVGVDIIALSFDGSCSNIAAAQILGCNFNDTKFIKTTFPHPRCNKHVAVIINSRHALNRVRMLLESKKVLFDLYGNKIEWKYIVRLKKIQESEEFNFPNKLSVRHINFRNQIMKIDLIRQPLSRNVGKALELCSHMITGWQFKDVIGTIKFIVLLNNLFDVFNSRLDQHCFKRPLCSEGSSEIVLKFMNESHDYIKALTIPLRIKQPAVPQDNSTHKINVLQTPCKTGVMGLLINIESLKYLYNEHIEKNKSIFHLSTYRFSQDHIELFFEKIRQQRIQSNGPSTEELKITYKKMLSHLKFRSTFKENSLALDNFQDINYSSALKNINDTSFGNIEIDDVVYILDSTTRSQYEINSFILSDILNTDNDFININKHKQVVGYISGWVAKKAIKKLKCETCSESLMAYVKLPFHRLITIKNMTGLVLPSRNIYDTCLKAEQYLKQSITQKQNVDESFSENDLKCLKICILSSFIDSHIFNVLGKHSREQPATLNHRVQLIKTIIDLYIEVRLHNSQRVRIISKRPKYSKLVLFKERYNI